MNISPVLTGRAIKGTWGNLGRHEKEMISMNGLLQNWSQRLTLNNLATSLAGFKKFASEEIFLVIRLLVTNAARL
jgi:hypothetical protein